MNNSVPSALEDHIGYWLRCLSNFVSHTFADRLQKLGISVEQWVVLRTLYDDEGATLNEAAARVGVDKSTLSRMAERLVQKKLINRAEGNDRRSVGLSLTSGGKRIVLEAARLADENDRAFFKSLSSTKREELLTTMKQLLTANGWNVASHGRDRMH